ncbi:hypothetical protein SELMODRAFT_415083 [Selaginella moellendorffii]|uniref:Mitochondrial import inner membrane translocase subunit TIM50 n=1 Tax=Selaginella moellendorffii TaxID=88036 RepID=D8RUY8_SELML|nr:CTD small phosphatase-like protein 2 [Selaginella moellendorffii]EFJ23864.1 hypothetical protein SELMODRAFT_415083 [Selaginella moellendorffii]|eukprot:XP_002975079.1 CTD small phosphatase-like protein 2 [Selaginella moellendorffii]
MACTKPTLVLDIDNTLVYGRATKRPGLDEFLARVSKLYEIVIFTSSNQERADRIIDHILKVSVARRLYCNSCVRGTKPLEILGQDLRRVVAIDDNPLAFAGNEENGLAIVPFSEWSMEEEERERHLIKLLPLLEGIAGLEDLRPSLKQWKEGKFQGDIIPLLDENNHDVEKDYINLI